jgi:hypothetical protein
MLEPDHAVWSCMALATMSHVAVRTQLGAVCCSTLGKGRVLTASPLLLQPWTVSVDGALNSTRLVVLDRVVETRQLHCRQHTTQRQNVSQDDTYASL